MRRLFFGSSSTVVVKFISYYVSYLQLFQTHLQLPKTSQIYLPCYLSLFFSSDRKYEVKSSIWAIRKQRMIHNSYNAQKLPIP